MHRNPQVLHLLAILLLVLALFSMPAGYYLFLRIALCILFGFIIAAHIARQTNLWALIWIGAVVFYNPIFRFQLSRVAFGVTIVLAVSSAVVLWRAQQKGQVFHVGRWF